MNADFAYGMTDLVDPGIRKKYSDAKLKQKQYSCSTFMLYLGVDKIYRDIPHHNILFSENYRKNVDEITIHRALSEDPSIYVQNASVTDKTLAPEG